MIKIPNGKTKVIVKKIDSSVVRLKTDDICYIDGYVCAGNWIYAILIRLSDGIAEPVTLLSFRAIND